MPIYFLPVNDNVNLLLNILDADSNYLFFFSQEGVTRTMKEICAVNKIDVKLMFRYYKLILKDLDISLDIITAADVMSHFCSNLGNDILFPFNKL